MYSIPTGGGGSCAMCIISDLPLSQAPNPPIHAVLFTVVYTVQYSSVSLFFWLSLTKKFFWLWSNCVLISGNNK